MYVGLKDKDIDFCINTINGRYPEKGYCTNEKCKEICYILEGKGTLTKKEESINFEKGDVILIEKEEILYWNGNCKIISDNAKYGNNSINRLSVALKLDFPDEQGFSARNLARMRKVYEAYKDLASIPEELEIISWSQNCVLVDKIEDIDKRSIHFRIS